MGIIFGPFSSTFKKNQSHQDFKFWECLSLVKQNRTVDFVIPNSTDLISLLYVVDHLTTLLFEKRLKSLKSFKKQSYVPKIVINDEINSLSESFHNEENKNDLSKEEYDENCDQDTVCDNQTKNNHNISTKNYNSISKASSFFILF
jgi:hypothetical protein